MIQKHSYRRKRFYQFLWNMVNDKKFRVVYGKISCTKLIEKDLYKPDSIVFQTQTYTNHAGLQYTLVLKG